MGSCSGVSAIQLSSAAFLFLFAVLWLDIYWVKVNVGPHLDEIGVMLKRQNWLNVFIASGAFGSSILLLIWVHSCSGL